MFTALSVILIWLSAIIPTGSLALVALVGVITGITVIECGYMFATLLYVAVSVICALLNPDVGVTLFYIIAAGWYPILKSLIERHTNNRVSIVVYKLLLMTVMLVLLYFVTTLFFGMTLEAIFGELIRPIFRNIHPYIIMAVILIVMDAVYMLYDHALTLVLAEYSRRRAVSK